MRLAGFLFSLFVHACVLAVGVCVCGGGMFASSGGQGGGGASIGGAPEALLSVSIVGCAAQAKPGAGLENRVVQEKREALKKALQPRPARKKVVKKSPPKDGVPVLAKKPLQKPVADPEPSSRAESVPQSPAEKTETDLAAKDAVQEKGAGQQAIDEIVSASRGQEESRGDGVVGGPVQSGNRIQAGSGQAGASGAGGGRGGERAKGDGQLEGGGGIFGLAAVDQRPAVLRAVQPDYPETARRQGIEGVVTLRFIVLPGGGADRIEVVSADPGGWFESHAVAAVANWLFRPARKGDREVPVWVTLPVRFRLDGG